MTGIYLHARLYRGADQGPNYAETAALTACSGILGHDGFLLRARVSYSSKKVRRTNPV